MPWIWQSDQKWRWYQLVYFSQQQLVHLLPKNWKQLFVSWKKKTCDSRPIPPLDLSLHMEMFYHFGFRRELKSLRIGLTKSRLFWKQTGWLRLVITLCWRAQKEWWASPRDPSVFSPALLWLGSAHRQGRILHKVGPAKQSMRELLRTD